MFSKSYSLRNKVRLSQVKNIRSSRVNVKAGKIPRLIVSQICNYARLTFVPSKGAKQGNNFNKLQQSSSTRATSEVAAPPADVNSRARATP